MAFFPLYSLWLLVLVLEEEKEEQTLWSEWAAKIADEGKGGHLEASGMQSFHRWTRWGWGRPTHMSKMAAPPLSIKGQVRIRAIPQQTNTETHKHWHREREDSHMEIQPYLFYFKIILFSFSFSSHEHYFLAMPLKVRYSPLSGPLTRSPPVRPTTLTLNKTL